MRAFIGISLPTEVRASVVLLQRELASTQADVKWVEPANLHVTLKFLGEITDAQCKAIEGMLEHIACGYEGFQLKIDEVGAFPSMRSPRVIWVGLSEGKEHAACIALAIEQEGTAIGIEKEGRSFAAHVTLGRVRSARNREALIRQLQSVKWQAPPSWRVSAITLYQSVLSSSGPTYSVLSQISLARAQQ